MYENVILNTRQTVVAPPLLQPSRENVSMEGSDNQEEGTVVLEFLLMGLTTVIGIVAGFYWLWRGAGS